MPLQLVILLAAFAIAVGLLVAGMVVSRRSTGRTRTIAAWTAVVSGLVVLSFGTVLVMSLIAASMDDVPGLW